MLPDYRFWLWNWQFYYYILMADFTVFLGFWLSILLAAQYMHDLSLSLSLYIYIYIVCVCVCVCSWNIWYIIIYDCYLTFDSGVGESIEFCISNSVTPWRRTFPIFLDVRCRARATMIGFVGLRIKTDH